MSGKRSRTKGHQFERDIAIIFRDIGFKDARRQLEYHLADCNGEDIANVGPFRIQCKRNKTYAPLSKIKEIQNKSGIHLLITKADKEPAMVCLKLEDFVKGLMDFGYWRDDEQKEN